MGPHQGSAGVLAMSAPRRQPSGHAKRQRARDKQLEALRAAATKLGMVVVAKGAVLAPTDDGAAEFAELGRPPLDNPAVAMGWVRKVQLIALRMAVTAPSSDAVRERLKWAKDLSAAIGMTHSKSSMEERLLDLEKRLAIKPAAASSNNVMAASAEPSLHAPRRAERRAARPANASNDEGDAT